MAKKEPPKEKITAWSFSRWATHSGERGCPFKAWLKFVQKRSEPSAPAMARGLQIHSLAESALKNAKLKVPPELRQVSKDIARLRKLEAQPELELCLDRKWRKTGWFDANAWLRIKIDVIAAI